MGSFGNIFRDEKTNSMEWNKANQAQIIICLRIKHSTNQTKFQVKDVILSNYYLQMHNLLCIENGSLLNIAVQYFLNK